MSLNIILTLAVFIITYIMIIIDKIDRSIVAMVGGLILVMLNILPWEKALTEFIDWTTLFLMMGMMIIVNIAGESGLFQYYGVKIAKACKGRPLLIVVGLALLTGFLSMILNNVTTILLLAPITLSITRILKISSFPFFITQVMMSNIGGTATIVGDPPNTMISSKIGIGFVDFFMVMGPLVIIIMAVCMVVFMFLYRSQHYTFDNNSRSIIMNLDENDYIKDKVLMRKTVFMLLLLVIGLVFGDALHINPAALSIFIAFILMLVTVGRSELMVQQLYSKIDWVSIYFFIGLFMLTGALVEVGLIDKFARALLEISHGSLETTFSLVLWISAIFSGFIDNIPFVATMIPVLQNVAPSFGEQQMLLWYALAAGACFGGNLTILGASANVVAVGIARREGEDISYVKFLTRGVIITFISIAISYVYLYFYFIVF